MRSKLIINVFFYLFLAFQANSSNEYVDTYQERQEIIWIDYYTVTCVGVGNQLCLRVKYGSNSSFKEWKYFYREIEGFDYQMGYRYKLRINIRSKEHLREDESSLQYELVEVLEKKKVDKKFKIDIYSGELIFEEDLSQFFLIDTLQIENVGPLQKNQLLRAISEKQRINCTFDILPNQRLKLLEIRDK